MPKVSDGNGWLRWALILFFSCASATAQNLITKQITVQPIQVRSTDGTTTVSNPSLILYEAESDKIWAQAGIDIKFLPPMTYDNSTFLNIATTVGQTSNELVLLRQTAGQPWSLNGALSNMVIRLFFTKMIDGSASNLGFTLQSSVNPGGGGVPVFTSIQVFVAIADNAFAINRLDVIAHELGHALSLNHTTLGAGGTLNLMSSPRTSPSTITDMYPTGALADQLTGAITPGNPDWTTEQIDRARLMPQALDLPVEQQYIYKAGQTITFAALSDRVYSATPFTLSATASSGLTVSFSIAAGPATISGNELTMTGGGLVTVRASQVGDASYHAAPDVEQSFTVTNGEDFTTWQQTNFTVDELADPNLSGPNAIFGLDGYPNLVKYALGLDPKINVSAGLPVVSALGSDWVYTYARPSALNDITYSVEISTDLITWSTAGVTHEFVSTASGTDTWRARYPLVSAANVYFRLKIVR